MKRLGEILVGAKALAPDVRDKVLNQQRGRGTGRFGTALLELGHVSEEILLRALSVQSGAPPATARDLSDIRPDILRLVPSKLAARLCAIPFARLSRKLSVAMRDPKDLPAVDEIAFLTGLAIVPYVALEARILVGLEKYYAIPTDPRLKALVERLDRPSVAASTASPAAPPVAAGPSAAPTSRPAAPAVPPARVPPTAPMPATPWSPPVVAPAPPAPTMKAGAAATGARPAVPAGQPLRPLPTPVEIKMRRSSGEFQALLETSDDPWGTDQIEGTEFAVIEETFVRPERVTAPAPIATPPAPSRIATPAAPPQATPAPASAPPAAPLALTFRMEAVAVPAEIDPGSDLQVAPQASLPTPKSVPALTRETAPPPFSPPPPPPAAETRPAFIPPAAPEAPAPPVAAASPATPVEPQAPTPHRDETTGVIKAVPAGAAVVSTASEAAEQEPDLPREDHVPAPADLVTRLSSAESRDDIAEAVLISAAGLVKRAALFIAQSERVIGWAALPEPPEGLRAFAIPFREASVFSTLRNTEGFYAGPCPDLPANRRTLAAIGADWPAHVVVVPVTLKGKSVLFLFGESDPASPPALPDLKRLATMTATALEIVLLRNRLRNL